MSNSPESRDKTPRHIILFLGFVLVVGSIFIAWKTSLRQAVNAKLAKIRAEGLPATAAELEKWYVLPPGETNGADLYAEAFRAWKEPTQEQKKWLPIVGLTNFPPVGVPLPEEMRQAMEAFLSSNAETLRLLHEAAQVKHCRYPVDLSKGFATLCPHLTQMRQLARLLVLQVDSAASQGNTSAAVAAILDGLAVGESLRNEPLYVSHLLRIACLGITMSALERTLSITPLQEAELINLELAVLEADKPQAMFRGLVGERSFGNSVFDRPNELFDDLFAGADPLYKGLALLYLVIGLKELDHIHYLEVMSEHVTASRLDAPDLIKEFNRLDTNTPPVYSIVSRMTLPALTTAAKKSVKLSARLRVSQAALAAERYRLKHGDWSEQLVAPVPADPFDGQPLRYRRTATGIVVWSIGEDGRDDGGRESPPGSTKPDIIFTIDRPLPKR